MDRHKKEQQGPIWRKIHLKNLKMKAKDGRVEEGHYLRERAAPGGRTVAWGSVLVLDQISQIIQKRCGMPKISRKSRNILARVGFE